jgi:pSer/pThr/pTyr-binding forkhead associated (FHA) protein
VVSRAGLVSRSWGHGELSEACIVVDVIFHHLSGTRATQVDTVSMGSHQELILGRANSAAVRFDAHRDTVVGRHHARIVPVPGPANGFVLVDLCSRNGTYLNGDRVLDRAPLRSGDVVQLGSGGPEVEVVFHIHAKAG